MPASGEFDLEVLPADDGGPAAYHPRVHGQHDNGGRGCAGEADTRGPQQGERRSHQHEQRRGQRGVLCQDVVEAAQRPRSTP